MIFTESDPIYVIGEINADMFRSFASSQWPGPPPKVVVSSPGGDIGYVLAMLDLIDFYKQATWATGIVQSAAAVLATAGEGKRICTMNTLFRFVQPEPDLKTGEIDDLRYFLHSCCVTRLSDRSGLAKPEVELLYDGKFIHSYRAKELGLIDEIAEHGSWMK